MYIHQLKENMQRQGRKCLCLLSRENSYPGVFCDLFTNHDTGNYLRHGILLQPIRGCTQHSGETGTRLSSSIHRVSCPYFFLREEGTSVHRLPTSCDFKIRVSWLMLSKALLMSKNTAEVNIFWSIALGIGSVFVAVLGLC